MFLHKNICMVLVTYMQCKGRNVISKYYVEELHALKDYVLILFKI